MTSSLFALLVAGMGLLECGLDFVWIADFLVGLCLLEWTSAHAL